MSNTRQSASDQASASNRVTCETKDNDGDVGAMQQGNRALDEQDTDGHGPFLSPEGIVNEIGIVKRQLIETQQTIIKLVDAIKKQQQQINDLARWAADNSDDVSPGGVILPS